MAKVPTLQTESFARVAGQLAQEDLAQQRLDLQARQQAIQVFNTQVNSQLRGFALQQQRQTAERQAGFRATEMAVNLGIKFDPGTRAFRPLKEEDVEFAPFKERQAERKARRPLSLEQRVGLEERREAARVKGALAVEAGKRVIGEPFERAKFGRAVQLFTVKQDRFVKDKIAAEERAAGRKLTATELANSEFRARAEFSQVLKRDIASFTEELRRTRPTDPAKAIDKLDRIRRQAQTAYRSAILSRERALNSFKSTHSDQFDPQTGTFNKGNKTPAVQADWVRLNSTLDAVVQDALTDVTRVQQLEAGVLSVGATPPTTTPVPMAAEPGGAVIAGAEEEVIRPEGRAPEPVGPTAPARPLGRVPKAGEPLVKKPLVPLPARRVMIVGNQKYLIPQEQKARAQFLGRIDTLLKQKAVLENALPREKNPLEAVKLRREIAQLKLEIESVVVDNFTPVRG